MGGLINCNNVGRGEEKELWKWAPICKNFFSNFERLEMLLSSLLGANVDARPFPLCVGLDQDGRKNILMEYVQYIAASNFLLDEGKVKEETRCSCENSFDTALCR